MCVVAIAHDCHPKWRLILAGNRDEFHARASAPLGRWRDAPHMAAGRDMVSGGSWLGVSDFGRLAVVTNVSDDAGPDPLLASRGPLVSEFLAGRADAPADPQDYNPFNLLLLDAGKLRCISNRPVANIVLPTGVHAISNGTLDAEWPRKNFLVGAMHGMISDPELDAEALFATLEDQTVIVRPDGSPTSLFIEDAVYGTRCSTVVLIGRDGRGSITERRFDPGGEASGETRLDFLWPTG